MTDDADHLARVHVEGDVLEDRIVALVAEGHVLHVDLALDADIDRELDILHFRVLLEYLEYLREAR